MHMIYMPRGARAEGRKLKLKLKQIVEEKEKRTRADPRTTQAPNGKGVVRVVGTAVVPVLVLVQAALVA